MKLKSDGIGIAIGSNEHDLDFALSRYMAWLHATWSTVYTVVYTRPCYLPSNSPTSPILQRSGNIIMSSHQAAKMHPRQAGKSNIACVTGNGPRPFWFVAGVKKTGVRP